MVDILANSSKLARVIYSVHLFFLLTQSMLAIVVVLTGGGEKAAKNDVQSPHCPPRGPGCMVAKGKIDLALLMVRMDNASKQHR